jgi:two-component system, OmpR family, heavy metal sensor histidine kinase CusS
VKHGKPASLTTRLGLMFAAVAAITFAAVGSYLYQSLSVQLEAREDAELIERMEHIRHLLQETPSLDAIRLDPHRFDDAVEGHAGMILQIKSASGVVLMENHPGFRFLPPLQIAPYGRIPDEASVRTWHPSPGETIRIVAAWGGLADAGHENVRVVVGRSRAAQLALLASYRLKVMAAVLAGMLLAGLFGYALVRRGLKPIRIIAKQAHSITAQQLDRRLDAAAAPQELQALVESFNAMLDRLHDSFQRLSRFSADLAHDMRTPINNLMVQTQVALVQSRSVDDYQALLASNIEEYERLARMMESMLFLARADHAAVAPHKQSLDLRDELQRIAEYFEGLAEETDIALAVDAHGSVHADAALFRRAVNNLVANAVRHAVKGSTVELTARQGNGAVEVSVTNHGATIGAAHIPRLFDRFYRADTARSDSSSSTGLGLAIVQSIMKLHGGSAEVDSADGVTRFSLRFPAARA